MNDRPDNPKFDLWEMKLSDPEWAAKPRTAQAEEIGVDPVTLWRWQDALDWPEIRKRQLQVWSRRASSVDAAVVRGAEDGDYNLCRLFYERMESWSVRHNLEVVQSRNPAFEGQSNFELLQKIVSGLDPSEKLAISKMLSPEISPAPVPRLPLDHLKPEEMKALDLKEGRNVTPSVTDSIMNSSSPSENS